MAVEEGAHGAEHGGTLEEGVLDAVVDDEIYIAAAEIVLPRGAEKTVVYVLDEQLCPQAEPTQLR